MKRYEISEVRLTHFCLHNLGTGELPQSYDFIDYHIFDQVQF